jgi:hypothetical protein
MAVSNLKAELNMPVQEAEGVSSPGGTMVRRGRF